jgi:large subunit ribosomal protein L27
LLQWHTRRVKDLPATVAILARSGCGTKWRPGRNVGLGSDYTIFALVEGKVFFDQEGRRVNVEVVKAAG